MEEYYKYLAVHVINQSEVITYRLLSRELKIHVNLAKQMLWEFHNKENAKKPGSVHATYLISGRVNENPTTLNGSFQSDDHMTIGSSPPFPSDTFGYSQDDEPAPPPVSRSSVTLVREEDVDRARAKLSEVTSIHIYSLQSQSLSDWQSLTECTRRITAMLRTEDNMQTWKTYGTIHNADAVRRTRKTPLPPAAVAKAVSQPVKQEAKPVVKTEPAKKIVPAVKRQNSGIAASFAKGAAKPKPAAKPEKPVEPEDTNMAGFSDDDLEDEKMEDAEINVGAANGPSKKDRQAELEAMMDVDDEETKDVEPPPAAQAMEEDTPIAAANDPNVTNVTVSDGRRRGRRRVTKKKTSRDADGYLVTKEEAAWESFSEDEPVPKKAKTAPAPAPAKKGAKPGQGNIMNFFQKK